VYDQSGVVIVAGPLNVGVREVPETATVAVWATKFQVEEFKSQ
jgi:hypothetical protein